MQCASFLALKKLDSPLQTLFQTYLGNPSELAGKLCRVGNVIADIYFQTFRREWRQLRRRGACQAGKRLRDLVQGDRLHVPHIVNGGSFGSRQTRFQEGVCYIVHVGHPAKLLAIANGSTRQWKDRLVTELETANAPA